MAGLLTLTRRNRRHLFAVGGRFGRLFRQPIFWVITAFGNGFILVGASAFHFLERAANPAIGSFMDSLYWAVSTVTTVGYGNVVPMTLGGKCVGILLMMVGSLFLWSYMALFVGAVISPDLDHLEHEIKELEADLNEMQAITQREKSNK